MYSLLMFTAVSFFSSCNEPGRGHSRSLREASGEAAADGSADVFDGKKQRDAKFVHDVIALSYAEIKLAELASQKARTPDVEQAAQNLLTDHTTALNELKAFAQTRAITVPVEETSAARRKLESLATESAKDFEAAWVKQMIELHKQDIDRFEQRLNDTEDEELKTYINKTLPVLESHRRNLEAWNERLKGKNKAG